MQAKSHSNLKGDRTPPRLGVIEKLSSTKRDKKGQDSKGLRQDASKGEAQIKVKKSYTKVKYGHSQIHNSQRWDSIKIKYLITFLQTITKLTTPNYMQALKVNNHRANLLTLS